MHLSIRESLCDVLVLGCYSKNINLKQNIMKKIILLIPVITALVTSCYGQVDSSGTKINDYYAANPYLKKANNQKTAAWVLLGGGAVLTTIGVAVFPKDYDPFGFFYNPGSSAKAGFASVLVVTGGLSMLGSIPLFIGARKNKLRANLSMTTQKAAFGLPGKISKKITGVTLSIPIGK